MTSPVIGRAPDEQTDDDCYEDGRHYEREHGVSPGADAEAGEDGEYQGRRDGREPELPHLYGQRSVCGGLPV